MLSVSDVTKSDKLYSSSLGRNAFAKRYNSINVIGEKSLGVFQLND